MPQLMLSFKYGNTTSGSKDLFPDRSNILSLRRTQPPFNEFGLVFVWVVATKDIKGATKCRIHQPQPWIMGDFTEEHKNSRNWCPDYTSCTEQIDPIPTCCSREHLRSLQWTLMLGHCYKGWVIYACQSSLTSSVDSQTVRVRPGLKTWPL